VPVVADQPRRLPSPLLRRLVASIVDDGSHRRAIEIPLQAACHTSAFETVSTYFALVATTVWRRVTPKAYNASAFSARVAVCGPGHVARRTCPVPTRDWLRRSTNGAASAASARRRTVVNDAIACADAGAVHMISFIHQCQ